MNAGEGEGAPVGGLLMSGLVVPVDGVSIANPLTTPWAKLDGGDYTRRKTGWLRQVLLHTTKGIWPQKLLPGSGKGGADQIVEEFWRGDATHSAAQIAVDRDYTAACLADLATCAAYHATTSNDWSTGIEMYQDGDGSIHEATLHVTVVITRAICDHFAIPFQIASDVYRDDHIIDRMLNGGGDCVGIFGHRDQAWAFPHQLDAEHRAKYPNGYAARGRGDPGDEIYRRMVAAGAEPLNFGAREDLAVWSRRQTKLNAMGEALKVDGVAGPGTMAALRRRGFASGRALDAG